MGLHRLILNKAINRMSKDELHEWIEELSYLTSVMGLTDLHFGNLVALEDLANKPPRFAFVDTERLGGLMDVSLEKELGGYPIGSKEWDPATFHIIGLSKFKDSLIEVHNGFGENPKFQSQLRVAIGKVNEIIERVVRERAAIRYCREGLKKDLALAVVFGSYLVMASVALFLGGMVLGGLTSSTFKSRLKDLGYIAH